MSKYFIRHFFKKYNMLKINKADIFSTIISNISKIDFQKECSLDNKLATEKHQIVTVVETVKREADEAKFGLCVNGNSYYVYNRCFWEIITYKELSNFLGEAAQKMGVDKYSGKYFSYQEKLLKQFQSSSEFQRKKNDEVLINLLNCTFVFNTDSSSFREHKKEDFLKYQLDFEYNPDAKAPLFNKFLDEVLPDKCLQNLLAEHCGNLFIKSKQLKLEKLPVLYGTGANGKSVFFEIITALLGKANVSSFSLQNLTNSNGYYREQIADKIVNYSSELSDKFDNAAFKQLVSGEPIDARSPHQIPIIIDNYAKMMFNCNSFPKQTEANYAFWRRLHTIGFMVTIDAEKRDPELANKIVKSELAGVFNWVLRGLERLLLNKKFSNCEKADELLENFRINADSVSLFIENSGYKKNLENFIYLKDLYEEYTEFCVKNGYYRTTNKTFSDRLKINQLKLERKTMGTVVYIKK